MIHVVKKEQFIDGQFATEPYHNYDEWPQPMEVHTFGEIEAELDDYHIDVGRTQNIRHVTIDFTKGFTYGVSGVGATYLPDQWFASIGFGRVDYVQGVERDYHSALDSGEITIPNPSLSPPPASSLHFTRTFNADEFLLLNLAFKPIRDGRPDADPKPVEFVFADAISRRAASTDYNLSARGKVAYQVDDKTYWKLVGRTPSPTEAGKFVPRWARTGGADQRAAIAAGMRYSRLILFLSTDGSAFSSDGYTIYPYYLSPDKDIWNNTPLPTRPPHQNVKDERVLMDEANQQFHYTPPLTIAGHPALAGYGPPSERSGNEGDYYVDLTGSITFQGFGPKQPDKTWPRLSGYHRPNPDWIRNSKGGAGRLGLAVQLTTDSSIIGASPTDTLVLGRAIGPAIGDREPWIVFPGINGTKTATGFGAQADYITPFDYLTNPFAAEDDSSQGAPHTTTSGVIYSIINPLGRPLPAAVGPNPRIHGEFHGPVLTENRSFSGTVTMS